MRILLTNNALHHCYGTEAWTYAMAKELSKTHEVHAFTIYPGNMSEEISKFCKVLSVTDTVSVDYDLALVNHLNCYAFVSKSIFRIFTSHSVVIDIESHPRDASICVGVSEETARGKYPVIRNGVDCERFDTFAPINDALKCVLYLSHPHYSGGKKILQEACKGLELITIDEPEHDMPSLINKADLVVGFGRGLMEAMACGRNVISADHRPYYMKEFCGGGMVDETSYDNLKRDNFTGRSNGQLSFTPAALRKEFEKYDPVRGKWLRSKALEEFNVKKTAAQYLGLYECSKETTN